MPFTFSHPAIILPFRYLPKKWFSITALIIGSLSPDFEYFIRMKVQSNYSHTVYGILWFDLPLALLLCFLFHNIARNDLILNSPKFIKSRILHVNSFNWNNYFKENSFIVIISLLIGITSHLFWDGFTHNHGYFTEHIFQLQNSVIFLGKEIPYWKIAQHLSTIAGATIITISFLKQSKNKTHQYVNKKYWTITGIFILLISILRFSFHLNLATFGNIIVTVISAFLISLLISPILIKLTAGTKI